MRAPVAAGFYPSGKKELEAMLGQMFSFAEKLPAPKTARGKFLGAVVPHAGYAYSGEVAARAYLLVNPECRTVVILGTNHAGFGSRAAVSREFWQTPLGTVQTDSKLAEKIISCGGGLLKFDEAAHIREHSIEVQLPFLQHCLRDFKIVAISVSSDMGAAEYGKIADAIDDVAKGKDITFIASSDFTHFGEAYGFAPALKNRAEWVRKTDAKLIDAILHFDMKKFIELGRKTTACGTGPVAALISLMKKRAKKAELVDYRTSFDVSGNEDMIVGYAGIVFSR